MSTFSIFYSIISLVSSALVLSILPWFIRFRSIPGLFAIVWLFIVNLLYGLNAAAFSKTTLLEIRPKATKLLLGMQMAVPTAMLCYTFSIHDWLVRPKERDLSVRPFEYRTRFHATICWLLPMLYMAIHIPVQDHRFDIVEGVGCLPSSSNTALGWVFIWQMLLVPFCPFAVYGFFAFRYAWTHQRRYYDSVSYKSTCELIDSELLFTNTPFGIVRIIRLSFVIAVVMLCAVAAPFYVLSVYAGTEDFVFSRTPDLSRVDISTSLSDAPPSIITARLFLFSGPLYSILLFAASIDKSTLPSYAFVFKRYILRKPMGALPDPNPGIDLSTLTPIPTHKRIYRRVMRKSRIYDPPTSCIDFDLPLPPRPDPGYRTTATLPPPPVSMASVNRAPRRPVPAHTRESRENRRSSKWRSSAFEEAMRRHVETRRIFPLHTIQESPTSYDGNVFSGLENHISNDGPSEATVLNRV